MAKKRSRNNLPTQITPYLWGYISLLEKRGLPIKEAYLFGSWAKGKEHKWSDIDVAIVSDKFRGWERKRQWLRKAAYSDFADIEPHGFHPKDFNPDESPIVAEILKHGIRLI